MIEDQDKKKLDEVFKSTLDPNLIYEESDDDVDQGDQYHDHEHHSGS